MLVIFKAWKDLKIFMKKTKNLWHLLLEIEIFFKESKCLSFLSLEKTLKYLWNKQQNKQSNLLFKTIMKIASGSLIRGKGFVKVFLAKFYTMW